MPFTGWLHSVRRWLPLCALTVALGCEPKTEPPVQTGTAGRASEVAAARLAAESPNAPRPPQDVPVRPAGPTETQPTSMEDLEAQVPDPGTELEHLKKEMAELPAKIKKLEADARNPGLTPVQQQILSEQRTGLIERLNSNPRLKARLESIHRPNVVKLTLKDAIHRALLNSNVIQVAAYNPAIEAARVVEAESQFDAVFFSDYNYQKQNRPSSSQLSGTDSDTRVWEAGVRKLLSSGMQVQTGYNITRTSSDLIYQTLNPAYFNQFFVEFRQPLLRGFGIDYNRSQIELRKLDRSINEERLRQQIRETLFNVEKAYWQLFQARRGITVSARLLTNLETILYSLQERFKLKFDVYPVQVKLTESRYEQRVVEFVRIRSQVKNAEDALKAAMNDPEINLAQDLEIIPVDQPNNEPLVVDVVGETTAALTYRSELREARLQIQQAQIAIGVAKNQAMPRLDLTFRYVVDGLGANWDRAFSQLSENDFHEYVLQIQFEWPIGNRGPEAQIRQARLRQAQAIATHRAQIEQVVFETQTAIRDLHTAYDQIGPSLRSAQASAEQLFATQARMERRDLPNLQVELDAHEALAGSRQSLLQALADYNIALINLERQKGTLLRYNNIALSGIYDDAKLDPFRPVGP